MKYSEQFMECVEYSFAAFCKIVLRNAAISAYRDFGRKQKHEVSLDYLMSETSFEPFTTDNYFEQYDKVSKCFWHRALRPICTLVFFEQRKYNKPYWRETIWII